VNEFYIQFDTETAGGRSATDYRTEFQRDRDRIIYCAAFRRLQGKTQVFMSGEYDFYRTRLTHSIEVAQIGRSIVNFLNQHTPHFSGDFYLDADLVEVVCLAHDIGHPPFGHGGENVLNELMRNYGGFEGNAQTLRIITEIFYEAQQGRRGMKPSRAFLDGIMKYKILEQDMPEPEEPTKLKTKFLYNDQARYLDFIAKDIPDVELAQNKQSIECQIMDWADDTAYSVNDLLDGYKAGFLTQRSIESWAADHNLSAEEEAIIEQLLGQINNESDFEIYVANKVGQFIESVSVDKVADHSWSNRYNYMLRPDPEHEQESKLYKSLAFDVIFQSPQIQQLEAKGSRILRQLFEALAERYIEGSSRFNLLPAKVAQQIGDAENDQEKARIICDRIAGMTDGYAIRIYKRIFDPDFGSIVDLI